MESSAQIPLQSVTPSPNGLYIAGFADANTLLIYSTSTGDLPCLRSTACPLGVLRWSVEANDALARILVYSEECVRIWDMDDPNWTSTVKNGTGGTGKIVHAEFGRTRDEALVFSDFAAQMTVWSTLTGRGIEIKAPKYHTSRGRAYRKRLGILAHLTRPSAQDVLSLHAANSYSVLHSSVLPTIDAQGLKWSYDERWIAVWDSPSMGQSIHIYTAEATHYRSFNGQDASGINSVAIRCIEWSPAHQYLAIGGTDRRVTLLSTRTFTPVVLLEHTSVIQLPNNCHVWQEQVSATAKRSYQRIAQPYSPPTASASLGPTSQNGVSKIGISIMSFSSDGSRMATKDDTNPTVVWLWDLASLSTTAVLIQHSPVKSLSWHPAIPSLLLISCFQDEPSLNIWDATRMEPEVTPLVFPHAMTNRTELRWLGGLTSSPSDKSAILTTDGKRAAVIWPQGRFSSETEGFAEGESMDSLYQALTGAKNRDKKDHESERTEVLALAAEQDDTETIDDTFMNKKQMSITH